MENKAIFIFIAIAILCMCVSSSVGGGYYVYSKNDTDTSNKSSNASTSNNTVLSNATKIQMTELNTQATTSSPFSTKPNAPTSGPAKFSFMMDAKIDGTSPVTRNIFTHGTRVDSNPAVYVMPNSNSVTVAFSTNSITANTSIPLGTYFNLLVTSDGSIMNTYINKSEVGKISNVFNWSSSNNTVWTYTNDVVGQNSSPIYIKNFYWWDKSLTSSEISSLPSSSTTSNYTPFMRDSGITGVYDDRYALLN